VPKRATPPERIPHVIENPTLSDHLAIITQAIFQAGLSWAFIAARWDRYVAEFDGFDVAKVAAYDDAAVARLMQAADIVHSRAKIEGTIRNARTLTELEREFGSVHGYQTSFASYDALRRDTQQRFAFLGDMNTYYWLFRTGVPVPDLEIWMKTQAADHPRIREMVRARAVSGARSVTVLDRTARIS
jgi:hypothetical protein